MSGLHPLWLVAASLALALVPFVCGVATSYIKISIILGLLRGGFGTQGVPGALVIATLSMALSLHVMGPVLDATFESAGKVSFDTIAKAPSIAAIGELKPLAEPWKEFMRSHAGQRELAAVGALGASESPSGDDPLGWRQILLAFVLTELRQAFAMGFVLLLPFLVIDIVVANILVGLGMFMLSPSLISLPLKLLLFIACDGWLLLSRSLVLSYQ